MKDFFMSSTLPYWLLFFAQIASVGYGFWILKKDGESEDKQIPRKQMLIVSAALLLVALAVIVFYSSLGGNALWWVTNSEIGFWGKCLRLIPLLIFLVVQAAIPFGYKLFMECCLDVKDLKVKSQFLSLVVIVPAAIIIAHVILGFFLTQGMQSLVFYLITGIGIGGTAIYSVFKNSGVLGFKTGLMYTVISFILCCATMICLLYFIVALISLIVEMAPVIATIIGVSILFGKSFGNAMLRRDNAGNYIAADGSKHSTEGARNYRDAQIHQARQNNS